MLFVLVIVTRKHLREAASEHQDAASELAAWSSIVSRVRWTNFTELRQVFPDADSVDGYVVFNLRHIRYRLITVVRYARERDGMQTQGRVYVRSFLTHKDYNDRANWDRRFGR